MMYPGSCYWDNGIKEESTGVAQRLNTYSPVLYIEQAGVMW
jgi:hypothetical protein